MTKDDLEALFDRVRSWPAEKQDELLMLAERLDDEDDVFEIPEEALPGIERGLADADAGRFARPEVVAAVFAKARDLLGKP